MLQACLWSALQELCSLHGHIETLIQTGNQQINSDVSILSWERFQGGASVVYDKAMQGMVIAALPLGNKGKCWKHVCPMTHTTGIRSDGVRFDHGVCA